MNRVIYHPIFIALFPILSLYAHNIGLLTLSALCVPVGLSILVVGVCWGGFHLLLRQPHKAALLTSCLALLFFSYGHLAPLIQRATRSGEGMQHQQIPLLVTAGLTLLATVLILRTRNTLTGLTPVANVLALTLLVMPLLSIVPYEFTRAYHRPALPAQEMQVKPAGALSRAQLPNIYFLVLDGYARQDVLQAYYHYANSDFLGDLRARGFQVFTHSRSNYDQTLFSLASTLNLSYLDEIARREGRQSDDRRPVELAIQNNLICRIMRSYGYRIVSVPTDTPELRLKNADIIIDRAGRSSGFANLLLDLTPLRPLLMRYNQEFDPYREYRRKILYALEHVADANQNPRPLFVLAHILSPHPPFVFGAHGEPVQPDRSFIIRDGSHYLQEGGSSAEYIRQYPAQIAYINTRVLAAIDHIQATSTRPNIIIIQGDHGSRLSLNWEDPAKTNIHEVFSTLSAIYVPDRRPLEPRERICSVNTFRFVLNNYFGAHCGILPNTQYFSSWSHPYDFLDVTKRAESDAEQALAAQAR